MQHTRREFVRAAAVTALGPALSRIARAQSYPSRPVRIIVAAGPGGVPDILARLIGPWLSARLGQQFVVDNRPGGGNNIGAEAGVRAPPDGYTLLLVSTSNAINVTLYTKLNFNFVRDIAPVATIVRQPALMLVNLSVPATTVPELIAYAKANPGKLNMGSPGIGSGPHMAGELFKAMTGIDMVHVPYRSGGGAALTDLLGGQVQVLFQAPVGAIEHVTAGKVRALAVTTNVRSELLPNVPAIGEFVPGYEASLWFGFGAPRATPKDIVEKLNEEINAGLSDPTMRMRLADLGGGVLASSPAEFGKFIKDDTEKWGKVIKFAGIKPD
jgi:tripartite-type tricarboxylate transporter receptor subunit TctC